MADKKIGVIFRSYAKKDGRVKEVVERAYNSAIIANKVGFDAVLFLVPSDDDCGLTSEALKTKLQEAGVTNAIVLRANGHHSQEALNIGVDFLRSHGIDYVAIVSNKAASYMTDSVLHAARHAFSNGARVVGVAVEELTEIVKDGRVQNTFAIWDAESLMRFGGFVTDRGVEEIIPLAVHVAVYGPCIAILEPSEGSLNVSQSADGKTRHHEVMSTKVPRQLEELPGIKDPFAFIRSGIMQGYPIPV